MMRLENSREDGLLNPTTEYSSLEMQMSEFDVPMSRRPKRRSRCYAVSACIVLIAVAAIVSVSVVTGGKSSSGGDGSVDDDPKNAESTRKQHSTHAPAPTPGASDSHPPGDGFGSNPPAPPTSGFTEPISSPPLPTQSPPSPPTTAAAPSPYSDGYHLIRYETICNETSDPALCLSLFASNPNSDKVDLQQWTIMTMEASERALNESFNMAMGLTEKNPGNVALQQCIEVFGMALEDVVSSMYVVAELDPHNPGPAATDVAVSLTAASTEHDTCKEGVDEIGPFFGSETITGDHAKHVDALLSIALTFAEELATPHPVNNHHRRLLSSKFLPKLTRVL